MISNKKFSEFKLRIMREIDTETSVVWPAWCYSGETVNEDLPQTAISPSSLQQQSSNQSQSQLNKNRGKRKPTTIQPIRTANSNNNDNNNLANNINNNSHQTTLQSLDKMLSERIYDRKKYLNSPNNSNSSYYEKLRNGDSDNNQLNAINNNHSKNGSDLSAMNNNNNVLSNNNQNNSNNTNNINNNSNASIKSERFSPNNHDVQSTASRSRSVTPSSFSGTPPQVIHTNEIYPANVPTSGLLPSPNSNANRPEFQARNYSDFMRSLAAKYNNNNEQSSIKNPFLEPKMRINQPKPFIDSSLSKKTSPISSAQVPNSSIMSSLFPGLPFQTTVFPPLIDMSSTQALVALARAAKESEIQNILKGDVGKKSNNNSRNSSPPLQNPFQSPFPPNYIPGMIPNHFSSQSSSSSSSLKSPSRPAESSTFPLDLSAAPAMNKRIKLSPNPSRNETSPAPSSLTYQQNEQIDQKVARKCHAQSDEINLWTIDNVCDFVGSIDICAEYVQNFRDQSIDGTGLPLLTEEHLTNSLGMKLGPALKLKSLLAKKLGGPCPCVSCVGVASKIKGEGSLPARPPSNDSGS